MSDSPPLILLMLAGGFYIIWMWWDDLKAQRKSGQSHPGSLPGATPASLAACLIAAGGALVILSFETWGEIHLGISEEQTSITLLFGLYSLTAAVIEEIIFRGYVVVTDRGPLVKWLAAIGASVLFAGLHPFLWNLETGDSLMAVSQWEWTWHFTLKAWFSTGVLFLSSLWFYTVRFAGFNPQASLLPCFVAHGAKNLGVVAIKAAQGFVSGVF